MIDLDPVLRQRGLLLRTARRSLRRPALAAIAALLAGCATPDPTTRPLQLEMVTPHRSESLAACIAARWQELSAQSNVTIRQHRTPTGYAVSAAGGLWSATQAVAQVDHCDEGSTTRYFKNPTIGPDFDAALRACLK